MGSTPIESTKKEILWDLKNYNYISKMKTMTINNNNELTGYV